MILGGIANALVVLVIALLTMRLRNLWYRLLIIPPVSYLSANAVFKARSTISTSDELSSWSPVFINFWFISSAIVGVVAVVISHLLNRSNAASVEKV